MSSVLLQSILVEGGAAFMKSFKASAIYKSLGTSDIGNVSVIQMAARGPHETRPEK
jgi:hypothetical protein